MKKSLLFLFISTPCFAASIAGYPDIPVDTPVGYATGTVDFTPGPGTVSPYNNTDFALGAPNDQATSLGRGGDIILSMNPMTLVGGKTSDPDFYVYEYKVYNSFNVFISTDNSNWIELPESSSSTNSTGTVKGYDIDSLGIGPYNYLKIVDTSNEAGNSSAGADIDGVILAHGESSGTSTIVDTDAVKGITYNLEKNDEDNTIDVKIIDADNAVRYIGFSDTDELKPIALSVQNDYNGDNENDLDVLVLDKTSSHYLNIVKSQKGADIKTIDNSLVK